MAAVWLREQVGLARWACVLGGCAGALVVLRPDAHGDGGMALLWPVGLVAANTGYQVLTSRLARAGEPAGAMQLWTGSLGLLLTSLALPWTWQTGVPLAHWLQIATVGALSLIGHQGLILAYRQAPASVLTPFLYLHIAFALVVGWLMFGHVPDAWAWTGVGLIAGCGALGTWLAGRTHG